MLAVDPATGRTLLAWTRDLPVAPKPDHVRELVDRLAMVRAVGLDPTLTNRIHPDRLRALVREGQLSSPHAIERYTPHRRRAILVAALLDLERRLTDAVLGKACGTPVRQVGMIRQVDPDADHYCSVGAFQQDARQLGTVEQQVIGPF